MTVRASIDLGTNTCLLLIAQCNEAGHVLKVLEDHSQIVRLGQGVDSSRKLLPEAMGRAKVALQFYQQRLHAHGISSREVVAVATSQARDAQNGQEFFDSVRAELGFEFRILTGEQEAQATFLGGLLPGDDPEKSAVLDIGGGSTELMGPQGGVSLDVGSVRFTERYFRANPGLAPTDEEFWACRAAIDDELRPLLPWREKLSPQTQLIAVAGTATTAASVFLELEHFDQAQIDGLVLSRGDLHRFVEDLKWRTLEEKQALLKDEAGRAEVILAGALLLWRTLEILNFKDVKISTRGLRFGVLRTTSS